jgi:hypothetical protein
VSPTPEDRSSLPTAETELGEAALVYAKRGWYVFPLKPRDKPPLTSRGFHSARNTLEEVGSWWRHTPQANIGLAPGPSGLIVFDIDSPAAEEVAQQLGLLELETLTARTGRQEFTGRHLYFRHTGGEPIGNLRVGLEDGRLAKINGKTPGLEIKADAGYVVAPPSIHPTGTRYAFEDPELEAAALPPSALQVIRGLMAPRVPPASVSAPGSRAESPAQELGEGPALLSGRPREENVSLADVERWLQALAPERCDSYHDWVSVLMALHHQFAQTPEEPEALALARNWSQQSGKYQDGDVDKKWSSFAAARTEPEITIRSLRHLAAEDSRLRDGKPVVDCTVASEGSLTVPTWLAMETSNVQAPITFWSNGGLAGLRPRLDGTLYIAPFTLETLAQHLAEKVADFRRRNRRGDLLQCYPPQGLLKHLLANPKPPVELPRLKRVVPVPVFAANGELITTPGYHPSSQTFYAPPSWLSSLRAVTERPTGDQVQVAVRTFDEHIGTNFPFEDDNGASRAHALALSLQGFVMDVIGQMAPLYDIEAAQRRTGKGLVTECCLLPAFGGTLASKRTAMPKTDEEMNKVLTALFKDGGALIAFDNVKGTIDFPSFEAALTAEVYEGRLLGSSTLIQAANRATWVMISNNPDMSGDLAGRAIRIRLISPVEYPEDRTDFDRLQPMYTRERLPELIWALHTLVRNWFALGCPGPALGTPGLGSYTRWREVMGGVLHAAGVEGFLSNRATLRHEVSHAERQWREFVNAWREQFGTLLVPTGTLVGLADLHEISMTGETERARGTSLGMRLGRSAGVRYFDRFTIEKSKTGGERLWRLVDHGVSAFRTDDLVGVNA